MRTLALSAATSSSSSILETDPSAPPVYSSTSVSLITCGAEAEPGAQPELVVAGALVEALSVLEGGRGPLRVIREASTTVLSKNSVSEPSSVACELVDSLPVAPCAPSC